MSRKEFNRKTRNEVYERSAGRCENRSCRAILKPSEGEYDHILPAEFGGEATAANCQRLCSPCHKAKTARDVRMIRKGDRQRDKNRGTFVSKSTRPFPGGKHSRWKRSVDGTVYDRNTGEIA